MIMIFIVVFIRADKIKFRFPLKYGWGIIKQSYPFAILILLMSFFNRFDSVFLERLLEDGKVQVGIYAQSFRILDAAKKNIATKEGNLKVKKGELDKIIAETEKEEKECRAVSEKARAAVDARLLTSFDRIRKNFRNGLAVVSIVRDACGGCFNAIPPQRQSEIRQHKKIMICENCGRILVDEELSAKVEI